MKRSTKKAKKSVDASVVARITAEVGASFRCFGGGRTYGAEWNPLVAALKDEPLQFAAGIDVAEVVRFVLERPEPS